MKPDNSHPGVQLTVKKYNEIKTKLLAKREALKEELKTKHSTAYQWLVDHHIDLDNLQKYSKNIAAAIALTNQLLLTNPLIIPVPTPPPKNDQQETANPEELSNEEKAKKVWENYGQIIHNVAKKYGIDPQLIFATIMTESEGDIMAYRYEAHINDASYGLGQVLYSTAVGLGFTGAPQDIYRPEIAIDLIGKFHKNTIETYGELPPEQMTVVYNTGQLFGYPYPGHLTRFREWYYSYNEEQAKVT